jgi:hypothetical protein
MKPPTLRSFPPYTDRAAHEALIVRVLLGIPINLSGFLLGLISISISIPIDGPTRNHCLL